MIKLTGEFVDIIAYYMYIIINLFVQLFLIYKRKCENVYSKTCVILKYFWVIGVMVYTIVLGAGTFFWNAQIICLSGSLFVIYNSCAISFDFLYGQPVKDFEEREHQMIAPLQQEDVNTYKIWLKEKELKKKRKNLILASGFLFICIIFFLLTVAQKITGLIVVFIALVYFGGMGTLVVLWNARIKDIENRRIENVFKGKAIVETGSPFQVGYIDSVGEYQHEIVDIRQRKEKQGTIVDIVVENGKVVLVESNLRE